MTYTTDPQGILWRSRVDDSERLQLTFPPLWVSMPRWSPDGTRIAFMALEPGKPWSVYVISAEGGSPEQEVPGDPRGIFPTWSPDGHSLLIGHFPHDEALGGGPLGLELVDVKTHKVSKLRGSEELWDSRWSPDGHHILAKTKVGDWPMLFDVKTQKWTALAKIGIDWPEWSRHAGYIYFLAVAAGGQQGLFRLRISDHALEQLVSLKDFRQAPDPGNWVGLAPDDSPLLVRDAGTQDIYALDWDAP